MEKVRQHDILPIGEGGGKHGTLIITRDEPNGGMESLHIMQLIDMITEG